MRRYLILIDVCPDNFHAEFRRQKKVLSFTQLQSCMVDGSFISGLLVPAIDATHMIGAFFLIGPLKERQDIFIMCAAASLANCRDREVTL